MASKISPIARERLLQLTKLQCQIFATTYNPDGIRAGNKILRQRLKGPCLASYYPPRVPGVRELQLAFDDLGLEVEDEDFEDRLEHLQGLKQRGKNAPKKKRTAPGPNDFKKKK